MRVENIVEAVGGLDDDGQGLIRGEVKLGFTPNLREYIMPVDF